MQKIDICLISETQVTRESYLKLRGYEVYYTTHPSNTTRGGSAAILKKHIYLQEDCNHQTTSGNIRIAAAYFPPRYTLKKKNYLHLLISLGNKFIQGTDVMQNIYIGNRG